MDNVKVNIINRSDNKLPEYATLGSAGVDLRAFIPSSVILKPLERQIIPTGLFIELPHGYEAQVRPRSGMALKQGITCLNSPGTIDSDYRGEIKVILINLSNEDQSIASGDRIAQMVVSRYQKIQLNLVEEINDTHRGHGGFGHSGIK